MARRLYVGNITWGTTEDMLKEAFASFGSVKSVKVVTDRETGQSRGFGFVEFESDKDAAAAMAKMNGAELDGRPLKVNEALRKDTGR
jgi:RNA recognition motif-containing protein